MTGRFPQAFRLRLTILYAGLFLAAGALLLGLSYGLLATSLPTSTSASTVTPEQQAKLAHGCQQAALAGSSDCNRVATEAANTATANQRDRALHDLLVFSLLGLAVMTVGSGGLGWVMAGRVLRPVSAITGAARRASERHLGERLDMQGPNDELKQLADTFDDMLERLDTAFASQRRFIADASHELRTPLTVMRTAIDVTLSKTTRSPTQLESMAAKVRRSIDRADSLVDALLTLAISEHEVTASEFVDLAALAEDALEIVAPAISQRDLNASVDLQPAETNGNPVLLERLVGNLIINAVRHNHPGGWLRVETWGTTDHSHLKVANSGDVIPGPLVATLFEPFRRIHERTNSHDGVGLGLAIVRSIAAAHGGRVEARARHEGGFTIEVALPRAGSSKTDVGELAPKRTVFGPESAGVTGPWVTSR
jgi:signal transduction histidine kinase